MLEFSCKFVKVPDLAIVGTQNSRKKFGKYHGSCFWDVPNFGSKKWVVGVYIDIEDKSVMSKYTLDEVLEGCVNFLNKPPPRKKYAKREPKPLFGALEKYRAKFILKDGSKVISALLITDQKKNRLFWGKGRNGQ